MTSRSPSLKNSSRTTPGSKDGGHVRHPRSRTGGGIPELSRGSELWRGGERGPEFIETEDCKRFAAGSGKASSAALFCPILVSEGQAFPVQVQYLEGHDERPVAEQAAEVVSRIIQSGDPGDILVFMPGMGEINATIQSCRSLRTGERLALIPLHGELEPDQQDVAFAPNDLRKVVVATNVAETSVTIDGVRHVVDSGPARIARYDADRGLALC